MELLWHFANPPWTYIRSLANLLHILTLENGEQAFQDREEDRLRCEIVPSSGWARPDTGCGSWQCGVQPASEHKERSARGLGGADGQEHHDEAFYQTSFWEHRQQSLPQSYSPSRCMFFDFGLVFPISWFDLVWTMWLVLINVGLQGNVGLIFTKGDLKEVSEEVAKYKVIIIVVILFIML